MSLDKDIKEAFKKHEEDAHGSQTSWAGIETKIKRAHRRRAAFVSSMLIVLIAGAAVVIPRIATKTKSQGFTNPSVTPSDTTSSSDLPTEKPSTEPTPTAAPAPAIPAGWQRRAGVQSAFQLAVPADWKGGWFEGTWDYEPKSLPSASQGGDTFTVTVTVTAGNYEDAAPSSAKPIEINGNRALEWQASATELDFVIDWIYCEGYVRECSSNFSTHTLTARIHAADQALWDKYESVGRRVISTLWNYDGQTPAHGFFGPSVVDNAFRRSLARFMDARIEGVGAEDLMCCEVTNTFSNNGELYQLNGTPFLRWWVNEATPTSGGGFKYRVDWTYGDGYEGQEAEITVGYRDPTNQALPPMPEEIGRIGQWIN